MKIQGYTLSIAITLVTLSIAAWTLLGSGPGATITLVNAAAFLCWRTLDHRSCGHHRTVPVYLLGIVTLLIVSTLQYKIGFPAVLASTVSSVIPLTEINWFLVFVVLPVTALLLGAYALIRESPAGQFMVWWGFLYLAAAALAFLRLLSQLHDSSLFWTATAGLASVVQLLLVMRGTQQLLQHHQPVSAATSRSLTPRQVNLWTGFLLSMVSVYGIALYQQAGFLPLGVIVGSMMGGLLGWRRTTARSAADPAEVVPLYLLLLALFYIHVGEEALTGFNRAIAQISGTPWDDRAFTFLIGLIGPAVWVFAAWSLWKRQAFGNFVLWFMVVGMLLGEPTHLLIFPVMYKLKFGGSYQYFSGMYTALFPMIPAALALLTLRRTGRDHAQAT